jgi:hypothetical protein
MPLLLAPISMLLFFFQQTAVVNAGTSSVAYYMTQSIHLAQCSCIRHKIDTYSLVLEVERDDWIGKLLRIGVDCIVLTATRNVLAIVRGKSNEILFIQVSAPNREHT